MSAISPLFFNLTNAYTDVAAPDVRPHFNTGTTLDVHVGKFMRGCAGDNIDNGITVMSGGLAATNGVSALPNNYKSTTVDAAAANAMSFFPDAIMIKVDTEASSQRDRLQSMSVHKDVIATHPTPMSSRITTTQATIETLETLIDDTIIPKIVKHRKDRIVEVPFIDPDTGKKMRILSPIFLTVDAISTIESDIINSKAEKTNGISDDANNPLQMQLSNIKTRLVTKLATLAVDHGLVLSIACQLTSKIIEDKYKPNPKELTHMRHNSYFLSAGRAFGRLMSNMIDNRIVTPMLNNDKDTTLYPTHPDRGHMAPEEFNRLTRVITRCKYRPAGHVFEQVISQTDGSDVPFLTAYDTLHANKQLIKKGNFYEVAMLPPEQTLSRTTVYDKGTDDYKVRRALELCYQHFVIKTAWTIPSTFPKAFMWDTRKVYDTLMSGGYDMDAILNSRGWWTVENEWSKKQRPYMSIMDVMALASGEYQKSHAQVLFPWVVKQ